MKNLTLCINKRNLIGFSKFIANSFGKVTDVDEGRYYWVVKSIGNATRNTFLFDKRDYDNPQEVFDALSKII